MYLLRQEQYRPLKQYEQVVLLIAAEENVFDCVPESKVGELKYGILDYVKENLGEICSALEKSGRLNDADRSAIAKAASDFAARVR